MPADVLDQLQEHKLRGLEAMIDDQTVTATGGGEDQAAAIADFLVDEGIGVRQSSRRLWDYHWTMALAGKIADRQARGAELGALLARAGKLLARGATVARAYADLSGNEVARLTQFEEQSKAFPIWVEERLACWGLLDAPRKPYDPEAAAEARAAFARGECEDVADILARVQNGGPLVKE